MVAAKSEAAADPHPAAHRLPSGSALGDELFDERVSLHGVDAEILADVSRTDPRPLGRQPHDAREHAPGRGAQIDCFKTEVKALGDERPCLHALPTGLWRGYDDSIKFRRSRSPLPGKDFSRRLSDRTPGAARKRYAIASTVPKSQERGRRLPVITSVWRDRCCRLT